MNLLHQQTYFHNMSNIEKYKSVENICFLELSKSKSQRWDALKNSYSELQNKDEYKLNKFYSNNFSKVLACLTDISKMIIENEFLNNNKNKSWYLLYFSKTTYYKYRNNAIDEFLFYYLDN
ncbi:MG284/MPN403 family protein [Mycoplasmopsis columbina]|uniref:MG284/MPN403 family protein n=1 Tax=Mycoplasmopsis columbina TaxID=114881 RepID=UPI0004A6EAFD|nr:hypothetical protein [Mycoplasmopsis columbina]VEU77168.1 Uncharacterised protein [Mycoplasmopsis columbina]